MDLTIENKVWLAVSYTLLFYRSLISDGGLFSNQLFILACFNNDFWVEFFFLIIFEGSTV